MDTETSETVQWIIHEQIQLCIPGCLLQNINNKKKMVIIISMIIILITIIITIIAYHSIKIIVLVDNVKIFGSFYNIFNVLN